MLPQVKTKNMPSTWSISKLFASSVCFFWNYEFNTIRMTEKKTHKSFKNSANEHRNDHRHVFVSTISCAIYLKRHFLAISTLRYSKCCNIYTLRNENRIYYSHVRVFIWQFTLIYLYAFQSHRFDHQATHQSESHYNNALYNIAMWMIRLNGHSSPFAPVLILLHYLSVTTLHCSS